MKNPVSNKSFKLSHHHFSTILNLTDRTIEIKSAYKSELRDQIEGREPNIKIIDRRYSDFENLHNRLKELNKSLILPALPPKTYLNLINMQEIDFAKKRAKELEIYLNKMLTNTEVCQQDDFIEFISNVR